MQGVEDFNCGKGKQKTEMFNSPQEEGLWGGGGGEGERKDRLKEKRVKRGEKIIIRSRVFLWSLEFSSNTKSQKRPLATLPCFTIKSLSSSMFTDQEYGI